MNKAVLPVVGYASIDSVAKEGQAASIARLLGVPWREGDSALSAHGLRLRFIDRADDSPEGESAWHQVTWVVTDLAKAVEALDARGLVWNRAPDASIVVDPPSLYGLRLRLTEGPEAPSAGAGSGTLRVIGAPTVKVATTDPGAAAAYFADLVGGEVYESPNDPLNTIGFGVAFPDHRIEFTGSAHGAQHDLIATFLTAEGPAIYCVSLGIEDFDDARSFLAQEGIRFSQYGARCLRVEASTLSGILLELDA